MRVERASKNHLSKGSQIRIALIGTIAAFTVTQLYTSINDCNGSNKKNDATLDTAGGGNDPTFALAKSQSFGFFDDITNDNWNRHHDMFIVHSNHKFPDQPLLNGPDLDPVAKRSSAEAWYYNVSNASLIS